MEGANSEAECKDACLGSLSCVAFDLNTVASPMQCWLHLDITQVQGTNRRVDNGVNLYMLEKRCEDGQL